MNHASKPPSRPLTVLVVEDETLLALNLEMILEDLGHTVIGPVINLQDLGALLEEPVQADVAILDVNVGGEQIFPYAERIAGAGIPIVFATGYGSNGMHGRWCDYPVIPKPYTDTDIAAGLGALAI